MKFVVTHAISSIGDTIGGRLDGSLNYFFAFPGDIPDTSTERTDAVHGTGTMVLILGYCYIGHCARWLDIIPLPNLLVQN